MPPSLANPYASPEVPLAPPSPAEVEGYSRRRWLWLHGALWLMIAGLLHGVVPKLLTIAADFGLTLSPVAEIVATASRWATTFPVLSVLGFATVLLIDRRLMIRTPNSGRPWRLGFYLTLPPLGFWLLTCWAVFSTLATLMARLSG